MPLKSLRKKLSDITHPQLSENMQSVVIIVVALASVAMAQVWLLPGEDRNSYKNMWARTWNKQVGGGSVFGTLGSSNQGLYGTGGYKHPIFNDARGKLEGQAYGTRVLGTNGDSTNFGGKLDFANDNAKASLDINKQIHGHTTVEAQGAGVWKVGKDTHVSAGGAVSQTGGGKPDVAVKAEITHNF